MSSSTDTTDRRRAFRYPVALDARVSFGDASESAAGRITNISETGVFVAVVDPPATGTLARLEVLTPGGLVVGYVEGQVVRQVVGPAEGAGVAVRVTRVDKEWIRRVVDDAAGAR